MIEVTLRDYFAAKALQGLVASEFFTGNYSETAYAYADAMLEERKKEKALGIDPSKGSPASEQEAEPIRVGPSWVTCDKCGEEYNTSSIHVCEQPQYEGEQRNEPRGQQQEDNS